LNYKRRRVVMIKYSIKIHLNKEIKAKVNDYFSLEFTEYI